MEGEGEKGTRIVCVTGGAGFLASWIIMRLLQHGYTVRTTFRSDPEFKEDVSHLNALPEASEKLEIFEADLGKPGSFTEAINGCIGVFHVAHPTDLTGKTTQDQMVKLSVEGTLGILKACLDSKTVKRVIYTSSIVASGLMSDTKDVKEMTEQIWTDVDAFRGFDIPGISYAVSKTLTERAAIEFAEENGLDLVTLLPSMVVGPFIGSNLPQSVSLGLSLVFGDEELLKALKPSCSSVHVDDIASAEIFLFECPEAKGRYICSAAENTIHDLIKFLTVKYPELQLHTHLLKEIEEVKPVHVSSKKLMSMGFQFKYGFEETYDEAIKCCKQRVSFRSSFSSCTYCCQKLMRLKLVCNKEIVGRKFSGTMDDSIV